jgi:hypothetical protein
MSVICAAFNFFANPLVALLLGAAITWFAAWWYYKKAGDELQAESKRLLHASNLILAFMENSTATPTVKRDEAGLPVGLAVVANAVSVGDSKATGIGVSKNDA